MRTIVIAKPDVTLVALHNVSGQPQAQAGSGTAFGGEKGLKKFLAHLRLHAVSVIGHRDPYAWPLLRRMCYRSGAQIQPAAAAHGVNRVGDQVHQYLAKFPNGAHQHAVFSKVSSQLYAAGAQLGFE
jgi:hypothetical protein